MPLLSGRVFEAAGLFWFTTTTGQNTVRTELPAVTGGRKNLEDMIRFCGFLQD